MDYREILLDGMKAINIDIDMKVADSFELYKEILLEWNDKINLTAIKDEKEIYLKHFVDSATCISTGYIKENDNIIDVGTGAGFPGLPIKLINNSIQLTLLDSLNKRISYLREVVEKLLLKDVELLHSRAEDAGSNGRYREKFDVVLSRAVASMSILCEYCLPFAKVGGYFICQKGPKYIEELAEAENAIRVLGGEIKEVKTYKLPDSDITHYVIIIQKVINTPTKYPRKAGKPSADPIR